MSKYKDKKEKKEQRRWEENETAKEHEVKDAETVSEDAGAVSKEESHGFDSPELDSETPAEEPKSEKGDQQNKNLMSALIIILGLFVGSIFVDIVQLVSGEGISQRALSQSDVFEAGEKTWVAYDEPMARVTVLTDDECEACDPSQALLFLRRYIPTMLAEEVDATSAQGEVLAERAGVKTLPAFVFDDSIKDTTFYLQAEQIFAANEDESLLALDVAQLGVPVGKYLELPDVNPEEDIIVGAEDAPVTIVEFSDFQCPYCKMLHPAITQALDEFEGRIRYVYKHLPLGFHPQAENAALASECADDQEGFLEYADVLFENQEDWAETEGTAAFKRYAANLGLNTAEFNQCLDSAEYQDKIEADIAEAQEFGVSGTPGTFVGDQFLGGAAQFETLKGLIEDELGMEEGEDASEEQEEEGEGA